MAAVVLEVEVTVEEPFCKGASAYRSMEPFGDGRAHCAAGVAAGELAEAGGWVAVVGAYVALGDMSVRLFIWIFRCSKLGRVRRRRSIAAACSTETAGGLFGEKQMLVAHISSNVTRHVRREKEHGNR